MQGKDEMRGASIAKGMRSCCSIFFVPIFSIVGGIAIGQYSGVWTGIFSGMILLVASFWGLSKLINKNCTGLSITDCFLPTIISISPRSTSNDMWLTAVKSPKHLVNSLTDIIVLLIVP